MHALLAVVLSVAPSVALEVPFVAQRPDFCGEAAAEMALRRLGRDVTQDDVFDASEVNPLLGRGVWTNELAHALRRLGVEPGPTWYRVDPRRAQAQVDAQWRALHADLLAGQPSIVCMHYDATPHTTEHFRLVTGYDAATDEVIYQDPANQDDVGRRSARAGEVGADRRLKRDAFLALWTFKPAKDRWTIIRLRLTPARGLFLSRPPEPRPATVAQHVLALKKTLPAGMTLAWEKPFLVIGDEAPDRVRARAKSIVGWCRDLLLKDFFDESPSLVHEVWVLKDAASYRHVSQALFHETPETPYGYYLASRRALIMNIKPGYGTLTHELVHPYMEHAWPEHPAWLNEGLASLFEYPYEDRGHLKGRVNWRLPALQQGFAEDAVPRFEALTHFSDAAFYEDPGGVHYAAARYLCLWLQEKGLLTKLVRRAVELQHEDPSGYRALTEVLEGDPEAHFATWKAYVLRLSRT